MHRDDLNEAMNAFLRQLPDPKRSPNSTIVAEMVVKGEKVKFLAQKIKGLAGLSWKVFPMRESLA